MNFCIGNSVGNQFFLYVSGDPGTGKTYLINTIISALRVQYMKSGMPLDKDTILILCPTASAAKHMDGGNTIHGGLRLMTSGNNERHVSFGNEATLANVVKLKLNLQL